MARKRSVKAEAARLQLARFAPVVEPARTWKMERSPAEAAPSEGATHAGGAGEPLHYCGPLASW